jgi:hypothetical protein
MVNLYFLDTGVCLIGEPDLTNEHINNVFKLDILNYNWETDRFSFVILPIGFPLNRNPIMVEYNKLNLLRVQPLNIEMFEVLNKYNSILEYGFLDKDYKAEYCKGNNKNYDENKTKLN